MTQPEVVFSIFEPEPEGMGMGLKLIDPQKWFVLDDFMVSDPKNHQLVLVPSVPDIWSPTPLFLCFSMMFGGFYAGAPDEICCYLCSTSMASMVRSGPWPPLHAPTPHLQGEFCSC